MLKQLITLIFMSIPVFAVDAIYAWGYGEDIRNILISIKFFTANATYLIDSAIAIGILLVMYRDTKEDNTDRIVKVIFLALVVSQLFFHAKKDYMVEDEVSNQAFAVTDIPIGIGELFSLFSTTERVLLKAFESSYSTPNSLNYSQVGLGFSMSAHLATNNARFIDGNAHETFMDYTTNCIASGMLSGQINKDLIASEDIVGNIRVSGFETLVYKNDGSVEQMSCQNSYDNYIVKYFQNESNSYVQNRIAAQMSLESVKVEGAIEETSKLFFGVSKSGKDYVMQQMGRNMLKKGFNVMAMTTGGDTQALAFGSALSSSTMENQWQQSGIMTQSTLPMIKAYLTSVILAMTPLLALLSIMFGDWKHIKMIITLLTTLILFSPLASVINYLMYLKLEKIIPVISQGLWMPMLAMRDINSQIFSYINFLGYAAMSIPILAYSLVKASEQGFVSFMSGMGGTASGAANIGAGQKVTGVNLGNTKVGGGSVTGSNGTTTDMGGGNTKTDLMGKDNKGGVYSGQSMQTANGNTLDSLSNDVASWKANNGKISSLNMDNLTASLAQNETDTFNQAKAIESSAVKTMSNTLSSGISESMAKGRIYTSSDDFSKNTGLSQADSRSIVDSQNEAIVKSLNKKLSESQNSSTTSDTGFKLGGHVGWSTEGSILGITGVKSGADGNFHISGTSTDGKSFSVDMSKDEMANIQKSVSDSLSKTFNQDKGLAFRTSEALADNEVFSKTSLKSDMDAYTKAHSIADKYSESYSKTGANSSSLDHKQLPQVVEKFIENDDRLKRMYESDSINAKRQATSEATGRINEAYSRKVGADYNAFAQAYQEITGKDLKGNISDLVNAQINQGKNLDSNIGNVVSLGQNNISNTNVNNSINQNPINTYESQSDKFKNNAIQDMNKHKEDTKLNTQSTIDKGDEVLQKNKTENDNSSRSGKALEATASGVPDIKKGIENLSELYTIKTPGSNGIQELKNSEKNWDNNIDKLLNKTEKQNSTNTSNQQLSEVKTQLEYLKDDISEITYSNNQPPIDKKGVKK